MSNPIDPQILEAMAQHRTSRRRFLGMGGLALGGLAVGPTLLAACSSGSSSSGGSSNGGITVLNWPLYIEDDEPSTSPTLKGFTTATGVKVNYKNSIDGNESFNTKYQATLEKGKGIGDDLIV
ncbi:MAG: spermidine/putrescine ABC transporter substrate-binding protein, partial [Actinobacteria bacterium]|nr:spermidine/putrescine ABC transporter substrate-binding protein [Actinomycetota bacterium]